MKTAVIILYIFVGALIVVNIIQFIEVRKLKKLIHQAPKNPASTTDKGDANKVITGEELIKKIVEAQKEKKEITITY